MGDAEKPTTSAPPPSHSLSQPQSMVSSILSDLSIPLHVVNLKRTYRAHPLPSGAPFVMYARRSQLPVQGEQGARLYRVAKGREDSQHVKSTTFKFEKRNDVKEFTVSAVDRRDLGLIGIDEYGGDSLLFNGEGCYSNFIIKCVFGLGFCCIMRFYIVRFQYRAENIDIVIVLQ